LLLDVGLEDGKQFAHFAGLGEDGVGLLADLGDEGGEFFEEGVEGAREGGDFVGTLDAEAVVQMEIAGGEVVEFGGDEFDGTQDGALDKEVGAAGGDNEEDDEAGDPEQEEMAALGEAVDGLKGAGLDHFLEFADGVHDGGLVGVVWSSCMMRMA